MTRWQPSTPRIETPRSPSSTGRYTFPPAGEVMSDPRRPGPAGTRPTGEGGRAAASGTSPRCRSDLSGGQGEGVALLSDASHTRSHGKLGNVPRFRNAPCPSATYDNRAGGGRRADSPGKTGADHR